MHCCFCPPPTPPGPEPDRAPHPTPTAEATGAVCSQGKRARRPNDADAVDFVREYGNKNPVPFRPGYVAGPYVTIRNPTNASAQSGTSLGLRID